MKQKPILFSTPMVQAILEGRKSMTRRVIKVKNPDEWEGVNNCRESEYGADVSCYLTRIKATEERGIYYPKYEVGDRLWVRETWTLGEVAVGDEPDGRDSQPFVSQCEGENSIIYKEQMISHDVCIEETTWKPSIHMPKAAARIWLEVTNVRVERLQAITENDARTEGCDKLLMETRSARNNFMNLWNNLNQKRGYGWEVNPWVWVLEFKRI